MTKRKRTNNDLQNITQKTKDRVTRTQLTTGDEPGYSIICDRGIFDLVTREPFLCFIFS